MSVICTTILLEAHKHIVHYVHKPMQCSELAANRLNLARRNLVLRHAITCDLLK